MKRDGARVTDRVDVGRLVARACGIEQAGLRGRIAFVLFDRFGNIKDCGHAPNLITDTGDEMYSKRGASVSVNVPTGMRLGTGSTAVAKNGAGAAIVTYVSASQRAIDGGFPTAATKGAGLGWRVTWQSTWAAGIATGSGIAEVVVTNETALTDVAGTAANTISRALISPVVNKGASDSLVVSWFHDLLGS